MVVCIKQWYMHFCNGEKGLKVVVERVWRLGCWCHFFFSYFFSSAERDRETDRECGNVNLFGSKRNEFEILREV